jgi:hypothetical protein
MSPLRGSKVLFSIFPIRQLADFNLSGFKNQRLIRNSNEMTIE